MNFRKLTTKSGAIILAGKDENSNEELIKQAEGEEDVFHTEARGSPFVNIKGKARKEDLETAAIFCTKYSKDWKKNKKDVVVHQFKGKDIFKTKEMPKGTFGVKKFKIIIVKKEEILKFE
jgi:predicted ribosome quality control (RQC) complex YloA/Tae2 family protein